VEKSFVKLWAFCGARAAATWSRAWAVRGENDLRPVASLGKTGVIATLAMRSGCHGPKSSRYPSERCPRILIVDEEEIASQSITRVLGLARPRWQVTALDSASLAARELERADYDVVVVDLSLRGLPGTALLEVARVRHPLTTRVVCSRQRRGEVHPEVRAADAVLGKPAPADDLVSVLALAVRRSASRRAMAQSAGRAACLAG
jgi:CheY-like chemotaxis protein